LALLTLLALLALALLSLLALALALALLSLALALLTLALLSLLTLALLSLLALALLSLLALALLSLLALALLSLLALALLSLLALALLPLLALLQASRGIQLAGHPLDHGLSAAAEIARLVHKLIATRLRRFTYGALGLLERLFRSAERVGNLTFEAAHVGAIPGVQEARRSSDAFFNSVVPDHARRLLNLAGCVRLLAS
jgi:hypothetical protein